MAITGRYSVGGLGYLCQEPLSLYREVERKYGIRDHRDGGRSSGRETAWQVMAGVLARKILADRGVRIVVHAVEIAEGFALARMRDSQSNDGMDAKGFVSNHAGGITGGIFTEQPIIPRLAVKPISSIAKKQRTVDIEFKDQTIEVHGRHDPCIVPRIIPVAENMAALVILDAWEVQDRLRPGWQASS